MDLTNSTLDTKARLRNWAARQIFKLPESWLLKMGGGEPVVVGGRTLDPHLQFAAWAGRDKPKLWELSPEAAQLEVYREFRSLGQVLAPGVSCRDFDIPAPEGHVIRARAYIPDTQDPARPPLLYFHMGGGVVGDLEICHQACSIFARGAKVAVVSVEYRLAPQHRFPAGLEDAIAAYRYVSERSSDFGSTAGRASVGGGSMGASFAASIAQSHRHNEGPKPALQLLLYPMVDLNRVMPSHKTYAESFMLDIRLGQWFMKHYLPKGSDIRDPRICVGQCEDLEGLPPAVVATAGHDPLVDEGDEYARRMQRAGVPVQHRRFNALVHGFTGFTGISPACREACETIADMLDRSYGELALRESGARRSAES